MSAFTDDDIQRLKELPVNDIPGFHNLMYQDWHLALLARLEAAERGMFSLETMTRTMREQLNGGVRLTGQELIWLQGAEAALMVCRKAAGKE